jgi:hypothetical protein
MVSCYRNGANDVKIEKKKSSASFRLLVFTRPRGLGYIDAQPSKAMRSWRLFSLEEEFTFSLFMLLRFVINL